MNPRLWGGLGLLLTLGLLGALGRPRSEVARAWGPSTAEDLYREGLRQEAGGHWAEARGAYGAASAAGHGGGAFREGLMLLDGRGGAEDPAGAARAFARALEQSRCGIPGAALRLAHLYEEGRGVPRNPAFAANLRSAGPPAPEPEEEHVHAAPPPYAALRARAEAGDPRAAASLCAHYLVGRGRSDTPWTRDRARLMALVHGAALRGDLACRLGWIQARAEAEDAAAPREAAELARAAALQPAEALARTPFPQAFSILGNRFLYGGKEGGGDPRAALPWFEAGARVDDADAWNALAHLYQGGQGVGADPVWASYCRARASAARIRRDTGC